MEILAVTPENINYEGIFCAVKGEYSEGINKKIEWYKKRYQEGLRILIAKDKDGKNAGFIEYVPGEYSWRTINAKGYLMIQCLQIAKRETRKGYGKLLLEHCLEEGNRYDGIAIVTSSKPWVNDKNFFTRNGFKVVDKAPPYFELVVKQTNTEAPLPMFNSGWGDRAKSYGNGVTVTYSDQCPFIDGALKNIESAAKECAQPIQLQKIETSKQAQEAPSPYGTFNIILNGKVLTHRILDTERYIQLIRSEL